MTTAQRVSVIPDILRQHVEGAAFLWTQRAGIMGDPSVGETFLCRLDRRLASHIDACMASGTSAWEEAERRFCSFPESGEIFIWLVTLLQAEETSVNDVLSRIEDVADRPEWRGASGATAYVGIDCLKPHVAKWSVSSSKIQRWLSVAALSHTRTNPGDRLDAFLNDPEATIRNRALRLLGELGLTERLDDALAAIANSEDAETRYWASRSARLLGEREKSGETLRDIAEGSSRFADDALELLVLSYDGSDLLEWLGHLMRKPERRFAAVAVSGLIEDESVLNWLLANAREPDIAAAVTEALRNRLPFDLEDANLLESDPEILGQAFTDRTDGPWVVGERVQTFLDLEKEYEPFATLPALRRRALSEAIKSPAAPLREWRQTRNYPAWS